MYSGELRCVKGALLELVDQLLPRIVRSERGGQQREQRKASPRGSQHDYLDDSAWREDRRRKAIACPTGLTTLLYKHILLNNLCLNNPLTGISKRAARSCWFSPC